MENKEILSIYEKIWIGIGLILLVALLFVIILITKQSEDNPFSKYCLDKPKYDLVYVSKNLSFYIPYGNATIVYGEVERGDYCASFYINKKDTG